MNVTDQDDEPILQSTYRDWVEEREREQQEHDERDVERFLAEKLKQKANGQKPTLTFDL